MWSSFTCCICELRHNNALTLEARSTESKWTHALWPQWRRLPSLKRDRHCSAPAPLFLPSCSDKLLSCLSQMAPSSDLGQTVLLNNSSHLFIPACSARWPQLHNVTTAHAASCKMPIILKISKLCVTCFLLSGAHLSFFYCVKTHVPF